jgi:hypothetical protein
MKLSPVTVLLFLLRIISSVGTTLAFSPCGGVAAGAGTRASSFLQARHTQKAPANHDNKWQPYFERLIQYREEHDGDCNVKEGDLAEWLHEQRRQYHLLVQGKKVRLTKKRAMALEQAGAVTFDEPWKDKQAEKKDLQAS